MKVLAIESSCDETAAAVCCAEEGLLSSVVASQVDIHSRYGGIVPEVASRAHMEKILPVVRHALSSAELSLDDIDGIAATQGPGLAGPLLVGFQAAKGLAFATKKRFVGVHHLLGHMAAIYLEDRFPPFPHLALVVSGGHTSLFYVSSMMGFRELGSTRDDAVGEAFDKAAKLLGLGYPGGMHIDRLAKEGDAGRYFFPRVMTKPQTGFDFSFSGLKTALLYHVREKGISSEQDLKDVCASFQKSLIEVLVRKTIDASERYGLADIQVCGGVAANSELRKQITEAAKNVGRNVYIPRVAYCTDNAAMIGQAGLFLLNEGNATPIDSNVFPQWTLGKDIYECDVIV